MDVKFVKLSDLVGETFTVQAVGDFKFKMWDNEARKFMISESPAQGYRKMYPVDTNLGRFEVGPGQMGTLLEAASFRGAADLNGKTFELKSNGKTGMDIRYYFNLKDTPAKAQEEIVEDNGEPISLDDIPF